MQHIQEKLLGGQLVAVAYLGFQKGGGKFLLATSAPLPDLDSLDNFEKNETILPQLPRIFMQYKCENNVIEQIDEISLTSNY